jgi:hypothetical protein
MSEDDEQLRFEFEDFDGWYATDTETCVVCGDPSFWRDHNGVPYHEECR